MAKVYKFKNRYELEKEITTIFEVSDAFLYLDSMTHMKLQKLCYYAYVWYLAKYNRRLFQNNFEAWVHGPVDPFLFELYRSYGFNNIPRKPRHSLSYNLMGYIESIYEVYGGFDGDELSYLSKMDDPWNEARVGIPFYEPSVNKIEDYMIKRYYSMLLENANFL